MKQEPVYRPGVYQLVCAALIWGIVFAAIGILLSCSPAHAADDFNHRFDRSHTCRGIVVINGTDSSDLKDHGSRLIRTDDITASCMFEANSPDGRKILSVCRLGYGCVVRAIVNSEASFVSYIIKVLSVRGTDR